MTTERDLIQQLADALTNAIRVIRNEDGTQHISTAAPVLAEARAYLDQPEPEGPTEEEMNDLFWKHSSSIGDGGCGPGVGLAVEDAPALICEALARWGRPVVEPEPEGLTNEEIEKHFQCWWFNEGSGMRPFNDEDQEAHVHRISQIAWSNGAYVARYDCPTTTTETL